MIPARAALLAAALAAGGCGGSPLADVEVGIRVVAGAEEVVPGRAFPLTVVRTWNKDLVPSVLTDRALAPLVVRLEETRLREDHRRLEETRRYRAYVVGRADVVLPGLPFAARPRGGGPVRTARADEVRLRVRPEVDARAPGPPEPPEAAPPRGVPWPWWAGGGAAVLLLVLALVRRARRRSPAPPPPSAPSAPPTPPGEEALAGLARIRARTGGGDDDGVVARRRDVAEAAEIVRTYAARGLGLRTAERTTPEVLASDALPAGPRDVLAAVLAPADLAKFAAHPTGAAERAAALDAAERFVRVTSADGGGAP